MIPKFYFLLISTSFASNFVKALPTCPNNTITWFPCNQNGTFPHTCGNLSVPLDYSNSSSSKTFNLSLVKVPAVKEPRQGSILFNPGGPGIAGTRLVTSMGGELLIMTGGHYDLIGFDPRGTGNTIPFSCYENEIDRVVALTKAPETTNTSDTSMGMAWAVSQSLATNCYTNAREIGEVIGTAFVARDMMQIVDAVEDDGMLRYWGFSYGTALGETAAAMFPDRIDKMVLDGVLNPTQYYEGRDVEELVSSDLSFAGFFSGCLAADPGRCALARPNVTASGLEQQIIDLLDTLKYSPIAIAPTEQTSLASYGSLKNAILNSLYSPDLWPLLSVAFDGLLQGNATAFARFLTITASANSPNFFEVNAGIRCGDNALRAEKLADVLPIVETLFNESFALGDIESIITITCANWLMSAKERYEGGFNNIVTKNPLLLVGNTYDPLTPLVSAQNASAAFPGSVVLQHNGYGHASLAQPSLCTAKAVRAYFTNGSLPEPGTICEPDVKLFSNTTIDDVLAPIAKLKRKDLSIEDDAMLLRAVTSLGGNIRRLF